MSTPDLLTGSPRPPTPATHESLENEVLQLRTQLGQLTDDHERLATELTKVYSHKEAAIRNGERREAALRAELEQGKRAQQEQLRDAELREGRLEREKAELIRQRDYYAGMLGKAINDHQWTQHLLNLVQNYTSATIASTQGGIQQALLQWNQPQAGPSTTHYNVVTASAPANPPAAQSRPGFGNLRRRNN